jgi:acid phosphatase type 7
MFDGFTIDASTFLPCIGTGSPAMHCGCHQSAKPVLSANTDLRNLRMPIPSFFAPRLPCALLLTALALGGCSADSPYQKAAPPAGSGITVYTAGDIADCRNALPAASGAAKTAAVIQAGLGQDSGAKVISLGDNTYPVGLPLEFSSCYEPTWGQFKDRTLPTSGNHEYYTAGAPGYYGYFGHAAGQPLQGYYSTELGKWHIVSLNSNLKDAELLAQLDWLKADLAQHRNSCTLAFWHHPVYSSGRHGNNQQMAGAWQALQDAGADLLLVSHDHHYERFAPLNAAGQRDDGQGIRQFVVGTGGAKLTALNQRQPDSEVSNNETHGVLRLVLKDNGYDWQFLPVAGSTFSDSGSAQCH